MSYAPECLPLLGNGGKLCAMGKAWSYIVYGGMLAIGSLAGDAIIEADICIYGGTASGVAAAVQAARMGKSVVVANAVQFVPIR